MDKTNAPNEKDREEQEDFWHWNPFPHPTPINLRCPHRMRSNGAA